jgi:protein gp37
MTHRLSGMGQEKKYGGLTVLNPKGDRHFNGVVRCHDDALDIPLKVKKPTTWFVNSMSDLFHKEVPFEFIDKVFAVMALCPQHTFQILTKRPEQMAEYVGIEDRAELIAKTAWNICDGYGPWPLPNVWLGTSVENQKAADERIPHLLKCPAAVRFLSVEPMLGPVDLSVGHVLKREEACELCEGPTIDWVIVGGESGHHARPCHIEWIRSIVEQCKTAGCPAFVKQLGKWIAGPHDFDGWKGSIDRWLLDNGASWSRPILRSQLYPQYYDQRPKNATAWGLGDPKGGDMTEWPAELRIREMPLVT